ncbi:Zinc finger, RING-CH-type,Zinc finger, RING/FYVE/PHD-type [Cinara cedri]|uniref:Zinc finger, RING-CH-type,Zinc finger, RING/FYVE/PHD-type n=1 Tax=Cinara cedri TaxID=506608 RepID=A0A5E4M175_9HEMI|nr:Zinc finger, RING-CH-type,Zinc finger, RING/FYVE/PHD-type [Cinara cedri]
MASNRDLRERSEEMEQMEKFLDDESRSVEDEIVQNHLNDNVEYKTCRICYDDLDERNECTISPCYCTGSLASVHISCLERWLSTSNSSSCDICNYTFKTIERPLTLTEWFRKKKSCGDFGHRFVIMTFFSSIWTFFVFICVFKTVKYFSDTTDDNSLWNGLLMCVVTFAMSAMLWFWLVICSIMWKRTTTVIYLDKDYLWPVSGNINNAEAEV